MCDAAAGCGVRPVGGPRGLYVCVCINAAGLCHSAVASCLRSVNLSGNGFQDATR